jgi:four helix bundle protein
VIPENAETVVVRRFEDLISWQLAHRLQNEVFALVESGPVLRDSRYCDQIRESTRSATRNTAEGFGRYYPKEFARFLRIAAGSLHETKSHLHDGHDRGYLTSAPHEHLVRLTLRALKANVRLQKYLKTARAPVPFSESRHPGEP